MAVRVPVAVTAATEPPRLGDHHGDPAGKDPLPADGCRRPAGPFQVGPGPGPAARGSCSESHPHAQNVGHRNRPPRRPPA